MEFTSFVFIILVFIAETESPSATKITGLIKHLNCYLVELEFQLGHSYINLIFFFFFMVSEYL